MSEPQVTILYYTSDTEDELFASKIRDNILKHKGNLPLISVSQKPLKNFGHNICVGEHDNCYHNEFRQIQIGLKDVKTPFVLHAEADVLYPPEYFSFVPPEPRNYRYDNVWILHDSNNPRFHFKRQSIGAEINYTQAWLERLNHYLKGRKEWDDKTRLSTRITFPESFEYVWTGVPVISFKTYNGINRFTVLNKSRGIEHNLPFWGNAKKLKKVLIP